MISTSYDLEDTNQRNSSASINDEESIFLSSSSDEDLPLSSRFNVPSTTNNPIKTHINKNKYIETMINDGLDLDEESDTPTTPDDSLLSEEATTEQVSDDEDEEIEYIPTGTYTDDIEEVSEDDDASEKQPTGIYDEYDPENLDHYSDKSLLVKAPKYEPTKLVSTKSESGDDQQQELNSEVTRAIKSKRVRKIRAASPEPEVRVKRKYVRKQVVEAVVVATKDEAMPMAKRAYNNSNRVRNSVDQKKRDLKSVQRGLKKARLQAELADLASSGDDSEGSGESDEDEQVEEKEKVVVVVAKKKASNMLEFLKPKPVAAAVNATANVISGRIINLSSGFKIPKRPSNETSLDKASVPPEKKARRTSNDDVTTSKSLVNQHSHKLSKSTSVSEKPTVKTSASTTTSTKTITKEPTKETPKPITTTEKVKVSKPKKERVELKESDLFMDALGPSKSVRSKPKPVKSHASVSKKPLESAVAAIPISSSHQTLNQLNSPSYLNNRATSLISDQVSMELTNSETSTINNNDSSKSNLTEPGLKKTNKRKVVWADHHSKQLEHVSYYELEEAERDIKKNAFKGGDMAKIEKLNEKEMKFKHQDEDESSNPDNQTDSKPWPVLMPIDLPESTHQPAICSTEHDIQVAREQNILGVLMFKEFLPDSPSEPTDNNDHSLEILAPKVIPLEDVTLNQSASDISTDNTSSHQITTELAAAPSFQSNSTSNYSSNNNNDRNHHNNHHNHNHHNNYYNKSHQDQQHRHQQEEHRKSPAKLFTPTSPPRTLISVNVPPPATTKPTATVTPLSPTPTTNSQTTAPKLYSKLVEDSPSEVPTTPIKQVDTSAPPPSTDNLLSINVNSVLSSVEMTEKIKEILSKINLQPVAAPVPVPEVPVVAAAVPEPQHTNMDIELPPAFVTASTTTTTSTPPVNGSDEYKKNSKWSTPPPASNYNSQNANSSKYGASNGYNNGNNNNNRNPVDFNSQRNNNNNNNSNRSQQFNNNNTNNTNNFRRGIGHRSNDNQSNHANFNQRNNNNYHNNNNNSNDNQGGYNRNNNASNGGGYNNNSRSGGSTRPYQSRFSDGDNSNAKSNASNESGGRYGGGGSDRQAGSGYATKQPYGKDYENDPKSAKPTPPVSTSTTSGKGGWV